MMSDSDPEGDKLDVKDLLGKCENKLFKKKLQDSYRALNQQPIEKRSANYVPSLAKNEEVLYPLKY